ncbi:hypothetical protein LCC91_11795 [Tepidimonas taiwanensis]|nr:hypothetical protein LCC91_11795 [Tepidimonas taiwanensis]
MPSSPARCTACPWRFWPATAVAHVSMAQPVCPVLADVLAQAVAAVPAEGTARLHRGGVYVCIEGPQFSSLAESHGYRSLGASVIGMTNMPEAKLAREAQIAYATLAMVTDYDCWHPREAHVNAEMAIGNLMKNATRAQRIAAHAIALVDRLQPLSAAHDALRQALVTPLDAMAPAVRERISVLLR